VAHAQTDQAAGTAPLPSMTEKETLTVTVRVSLLPWQRRVHGTAE